LLYLGDLMHRVTFCVRRRRCAATQVTIDMARLQTSGASVGSPYRDEDELKRILSELHVDRRSPAAVHELYWKLGAIIGNWLSELEERREASPIAKALLSTAKNLSEVSRLLSGHETGFRTSVEIGVTSEMAKYLALDPTVGSLAEAQELVSAFHREAARIAHVSLVAYTALADQPAERGRPALDWYNDFTALLLEIAIQADVAPTLRKDRITGARSGWLFEAAQALEAFLCPEMRSPSEEACGTRLDRSKRRLQRRTRQNSPAR
jgi:hypothetical protein